MSGSLTFHIPFVHGLQRSRSTRTGHHYDTPQNIEDKWTIRDAYEDARRRSSLPDMHRYAGPVGLTIDAIAPLPKSRPKSVTEEWWTMKPDVDNVVKLVMDALSGLAWRDDAQVVVVKAAKLKRTRGVDDASTCITIDWRE